MGLDLHATARQVDALAGALRGRRQDHDTSVQEALARLETTDPDLLRVKAEASQRTFTFLAARLVSGLSARYDAPAAPADSLALAVDGSHIDVDRNVPPRCFLINVSRIALRYGAAPDALIESEPRIYASPDELFVRDTATSREMPIEGPLLGLVRTIVELETLATLCESQASDLPTLALVDGTLVLWALGGEGFPEFVRRHLVDDRLLPALDRIRAVAQTRRLALAAYVSLPRSTEVVNLLRLVNDQMRPDPPPTPATPEGVALRGCPYDTANCDRYCGALRAGQRPCDAVHGLTDRDVFAQLLAPGQRSETFASASSVLKQYGPHAAQFFYVNSGEEIGRVEVPAWVADDEALLALTHTLVLDQCRRGQGYPVALMEAHERAVVTGADRDLFRQLVDDALHANGVPLYTSEKALSKRTRWL